MSLLQILFNTLADGEGAATLTLNALSSSDSDTSSPYSSKAGIRVDRDGFINELSGGASWVKQNSGIEWIDDNSSDIGDSYEVYVTQTSGNEALDVGTEDSWTTINTNLEFSFTRTAPGVGTWLGTIEIREIADTGNTTGAVNIVLDVDNGFAK